jgi:hypothetical protein
LTDDADELETEQRLDPGQHNASLGQHLGNALGQRGVFLRGLLTSSDCPLPMTSLPPSQILKAVPTRESEKQEKSAADQPE